jgi:hypothetical protein
MPDALGTHARAAAVVRNLEGGWNARACLQAGFLFAGEENKPVMKEYTLRYLTEMAGEV